MAFVSTANGGWSNKTKGGDRVVSGTLGVFVGVEVIVLAASEDAGN